MAKDTNVLVLTGRLTRDIEIKYGNSGIAIGSFSIASNRIRKDTNGKWNDAVSFFECTLFGKTVEGVGKYLTKGKQVNITGELTQDRWQQDGVNRSKVKIIVSQIQLLGGTTMQKSDDSFSAVDNNDFDDDASF